MAKRINPIHPGEVLKEDFMEPLGVTAYRLAQGEFAFSLNSLNGGRV